MKGSPAASRLAGIPDLLGSLGVILAAAAWGTSGVFVTYVARATQVSALALAFWRDLAVFCVLLISVSVLRPSWLRVSRSQLPWLAALGGSLGLFHVLWNLGVFLSGAAVATVQQAAMPAIVSVVAWLIWRETLSWSKIVAIILAFIGTALASGINALGQAEFSLGSFLVGVGIPAMYAAWSLLGKQARKEHNAVTTLTYAFGFGALVLLPFQFFTPQPWPVESWGWLWFVGLILVASILPFVSYTWALGRLHASVASILAMSEIVFVAVYATVLLGERPTMIEVLGAVLVVGGVLMLWWQGTRNRSLRDTR